VLIRQHMQCIRASLSSVRTECKVSLGGFYVYTSRVTTCVCRRLCSQCSRTCDSDGTVKAAVSHLRFHESSVEGNCECVYGFIRDSYEGVYGAGVREL
jgi:hypothetical protein